MTDRGFVCPRHEIFVKPGEMCRYCEPQEMGAAAPQPLSDTVPATATPVCGAFHPVRHSVCGASAAWLWTPPVSEPWARPTFVCPGCHASYDPDPYFAGWTRERLDTVSAAKAAP